MLALGAVTYDDDFSMRKSAVRWVYEAQNWLAMPEFKARLNLQMLQTNLLLLLAREAINVGGELIWISAGAVFRTAVYMGLHRDPIHLPKRTLLASEMRRRIWNTILEIMLQSSIVSGGPPFFSLDDFDTSPPRNFNDDQLNDDDPVPKPDYEFTEISIARALRQTFPVRLAVTKFLNDLGTNGSYEETLRLDSDLRASYKALRLTIQGYTSRDGASNYQFELLAMDLLMNHTLLSLHLPFYGRSMHEIVYAFSRKVVVETSIKIWYSVYPSSSVMVARSRNGTASSEREGFARFTQCGSGLFRTVAFQSCLLIVAEIKNQLQEEESLGSVPLRPDLFSVLQDAKVWCWRCIEAGETNIKCYLLMSILNAQIKGMMQGLGREELAVSLIKTAEEAEERCSDILKQKLAQSRVDGTIDELDQMSLNMPTELIEDWDLMVSRR